MNYHVGARNPRLYARDRAAACAELCVRRHQPARRGATDRGYSRARLGYPATDPTVRHVIMVVQVERQVVGLLVDAVLDILTVADTDIQPTPDVASEMAKIFTRGVLAIDGRMISWIALEHCFAAGGEAMRRKAG